MNNIVGIKREIEYIKSELKFRKSLGMATSDLIDRLEILEKEERVLTNEDNKIDYQED